ncbi:DNA damage-binding protein 1a [Asimina triloba]
MGAPKQKWTAEEEAALKAGVVKHGAGKWRTILKDPEFSGVLALRSNVDLKDKWRNMSVTANGWGSREKARLALKKSQQIPRPDENSMILSTVDGNVGEEIVDAKPLAVSNGMLQITGSKRSISRLDNLIVEAITNLKEPSGSNKTAIAVYIEVKRKYRIAPVLAFSEGRSSGVLLLEGRPRDSLRVDKEDFRHLTKSQIDSELAKMRTMTAQEAAAAAAQAVAEAELAMAEAEEAAREAEVAEADAEAAQAFAEAAMMTLKSRSTTKLGSSMLMKTSRNFSRISLVAERLRSYHSMDVFDASMQIAEWPSAKLLIIRGLLLFCELINDRTTRLATNLVEWLFDPASVHCKGVATGREGLQPDSRTPLRTVRFLLHIALRRLLAGGALDIDYTAAATCWSWTDRTVGREGRERRRSGPEKPRSERKKRFWSEICRFCRRMSVWNYVVTAHKPTNVTHSCVGNFTSPQELNLIIAYVLLPLLSPPQFPARRWVFFGFRKCTRIEIHLLTPQGLQPMLDVPIYGRIATLELFRPHGEAQDFLFIATERYKFCVLQWDAETSELITRAMGDVSDRIGRPTDNGQIGIIDPECRLIGLHLYDGLFKVIPFDNKGQLKEAFNIRLEELQVLDIKFLYGYGKPTIAVLFQDNKDARHVKTYEVALKDKDFIEGPWSQNNLDNGAGLLIPVPMPLGGVIIIGEETIVYCSATAFKAIPIRPSITRAYGRVDADGSRYLLSDHAGLLHLLIIAHEKERVTGLKIELLGETSIASTISYLDNAFVFVGASYGDSQLIKLNLQPDSKGSYVEVLERYVNLGPIVDFCVVDLEREGQGQVVTCSGAYKDGSLRIVRNGIGINEQASVELQGIKGMWSLRSSTDDLYDTFLVVSFISETRILAMNTEDELEETEIEGFYSQAQTLFCQDAIHNQLVQVTATSVRLVSSTTRELRDEWKSPSGFSVNVATANASQLPYSHCAYIKNDLVIVELSAIWYLKPCMLVLGRVIAPELSLCDMKPLSCDSELVTLLAGNEDTTLVTDVHAPLKGSTRVYLEIGDGTLTEVKHAQLEYEISCLDINPIGTNPNYSSLAAVGMWTDISVRIFSLPGLELITKECLGGEIIPRSVLLCSFEGVSYLLCALGDGHLFNFLLNTNTGELSDRKKISLGTQPITLRTFSSKNTTHVFAASDRPTVIYSSNKKLLYSNVNLKEVSHMCPFNSSAFPDSLAIAKEGELTIGTIDDIQKLHIRSIPLGEHARRICHQEQSRTFAICSLKYCQSPADESEMHFVRLLDDQTFEFVSTYPLDTYEYGCSILSCSFTDDPNVYYCVGTSYVLPDENEPTKGRILVFIVEDGKLQLIAEKETKGAVYCLNAFNGKLLAAINQKIQLYKWMLREDGSRELQSESGHHGHILALYVQTRGDFIVVGDLMKSISLLIYKHEEGAIEELARDYNANWMSAVEILDDDIYLGAENNFNLFTVRKNSEGATDEERGRLEVVGEFHLGEFVNRFRHGSLVMRLPDSDVGQIPTVIFGTVNGVIGVIASLPHEQYVFLEKLQSNLVKVIKGVGGLSHEQWRSFNNEKKTVDAKNFLDGDLIESFLDLSRSRMEEISKAMNVSVEELCKRVEELTRLH